MAASIEDSAGLDDQAGGTDLASDYTLGQDFDFSLGGEHPFKSAADDYVAAIDFAFDAGVFANYHSGIRNNRPLHMAVDAERSGKLDFALDAHSLIEEAYPFAEGADPLRSNKLIAPSRAGKRFYLGRSAVSSRNSSILRT